MIRQTAIACVLSCAAAQAPAGITWGVNGHPLTAYPGIPISDQLDLVRDLGMKSYRVNVSYADQFEHLAAIIDAADARGIEILPVLTPGGLDFENDSEDVIYHKSFDFAHQLASRFANDIPVWELGNEEENRAIIQPCEMREDGTQYPCDWGPAGGVDPLDYHGERWDRVSALLRGLSDGIEAAAPEAMKAMGTAGWGHLGAFERMRRDGIDWDISVWHIYGEDPEWAFEILKGFHRPIWVTELNHPYGSRDGEEAQAEGLVAMMSRLRSLSGNYGVEAIHIYELLDESYWAPDIEAVMGLAALTPTPEAWMVGPPKPAYRQVRDLILRTPPTRCEDLPGAFERPSPGLQSAYGHCLALGHIPDPGEVQEWADTLARGDAGPIGMVATLISSTSSELSDEADNGAYVNSLYHRLLGREPDGHGLESYRDQLETGAITRRDLAVALMTSDEFRARHPVLAHEGPNASSRNCDLDGIQSGGPEGRRAVAYAACLLLGQDAGGTSLSQWEEAIAGGTVTVPELLAAVLRSAVFEARHGTEWMSHSEYVSFIYQLLLGRDPDGLGARDYVAQLESGSLERDALRLALTESSEFAARHPVLSEPVPAEAEKGLTPECDGASTVEARSQADRAVVYLHCLLLGVAPQPNALRHWSETLTEGGASKQDLVISLLRSGEFEARHEPEKLSDPDFVSLIFRLLLGREPDGDGLATYVGQLADGTISREDVALGTFWSSEFMGRHAALAE